MPQFENLGEKSSLKDKVYETLKTEIILGRFKAGERLNILELANAMNISSAPIREALNMLSADGFVELTPRKKAIVTDATLRDYAVVMELRQMLEPYAAKMSVGKIPAEKIAEMRRQLAAVLEDPDDMYKYVASDLALHELMHQYAGSDVLSDILTTVKEQSLRIRYCVEELAAQDKVPHFIATSTQEHLDILDALESGSPDEVYRRVKQHLDNYIQRSEADEGIMDALIKDAQGG